VRAGNGAAHLGLGVRERKEAGKHIYRYLGRGRYSVPGHWSARRGVRGLSWKWEGEAGRACLSESDTACG
jgi:hypothetical protein